MLEKSDEILEYLISIKATEKYGELTKLADEVFDKTAEISKIIIQFIESQYINKNEYPDTINEVYLKAKKFIE